MGTSRRYLAFALGTIVVNNLDSEEGAAEALSEIRVRLTETKGVIDHLERAAAGLMGDMWIDGDSFERLVTEVGCVSRAMLDIMVILTARIARRGSIV